MNLRFFRLFILIIGISGTFPLRAQVKEDFSDGELSSGPVWAGDIGKFAVRKYDTSYYLLDLNDHEKGNAAISTPSTFLRNTEWKFHFQLNGKTRNKSSYARFYLAADSPDLRGKVNGYFIDFGSRDGLITLVRQNGAPSDTVILIDSKAEMSLSHTSSMEMRITCSPKGEWILYADIGNGTYSKWGTSTDTTYETSKYIGIFCTYTKTNSTNFSFGSIAVTRLNESTDEEKNEGEGENGEFPEEGERPPSDPDEGGDPPSDPDEDLPGENEDENTPPEEKEEPSESPQTGFYLERRSFSPDGDGINDEISLSYTLPEEGYEVLLTVYNASGRKIRSMEPTILRTASGDLLSSEIKWDGKQEDGEIAPAGLYILNLVATHPLASRISAKRVVALTY